jgi:pyridoxal phosphate enzyme (YggS family)
MASTPIQDKLLSIQGRIAAAAHKVGRRPEEVTVIAVSKTQPTELIRAAYDAGIRHFGENRVQEWEEKRAAVQDLAATWHMIGHLQSNKAARAAGLFDSVDSVDDFTLAQRLDRARSELGISKKLRLLMEVRLAPEENKTGTNVADLPPLAEKVTTLSRLEFAGLMCIPPFLQNAEEVRPYFRQLRELRDDLAARLGRPFPVLSMGMSHDFEIAIEEGATEVRIGTAIFGSRAG